MYSWNQVVHNCTTGQPYSLAALNSDATGPYTTWAWKLPNFPIAHYEDVATGKAFNHPNVKVVRKLLLAGLIRPSREISHPSPSHHTPAPSMRTKDAKRRRTGLASKVKGP